MTQSASSIPAGAGAHSDGESVSLEEGGGWSPERLAACAGIDKGFARLEEALPREMAALQLESLGRIVLHAAGNTGFYRDRLGPVVGGGAFDPSWWNEVPILTRAEVQENFAALRATRVPDGEHRAYEMTTSGSTGTPMRFATSALTITATRAMFERAFAWHDLDVNATLVEIRAPETRSSRGGWSYRGPSAEFHSLSVMAPPAEQLAFLRATRPRYLLTFPTMARELAVAASELSGAAIEFDAVISVGEILTDEVRALVRAAFGARMIDTYGCREMGKVALQCNRSPLLHVCAPIVFLEALDDAGQPVGAGGVGRAVVTSLYNFAMPFIRYELGDYVRLAEAACPCGRPLPVIAEVMGRRRNMLKLPNGGRMLVSGKVLTGMAAFIPMRQFRLAQRSERLLELLYVPDASGRPADVGGLSAYLRANIHPDIEVSIDTRASLPRSAGGKYEDVVGVVD